VTSGIPSPREIAAALGARVIGQGDAVREMAIALSKKLAGLRVGNILMIGSSGTGKTTLMRAVEGYLAANPELAVRSTVIRLHANVLGEEAESGRPGEAVLRRLLERAREQNVGVPALRSTDFINTIPPEREPWFPGNEAIERRIRSYIRWNAAVMVSRANRPGLGVGGHIATYK